MKHYRADYPPELFYEGRDGYLIMEMRSDRYATPIIMNTIFSPEEAEYFASQLRAAAIKAREEERR